MLSLPRVTARTMPGAPEAINIAKPARSVASLSTGPAARAGFAAMAVRVIAKPRLALRNAFSHRSKSLQRQQPVAELFVVAQCGCGACIAHVALLQHIDAVGQRQ